MNLTLTVDDDIVKTARIRALQQGTSVNEVVRRYLTSYADASSERSGALHDLFRDSDAQQAPDKNNNARNWKRDDAYDDPRFR